MASEEPPIIEETVVEQPQKKNENTLININTSDCKTLQTLPGIGKVLAERIIEAREVRLFQNLYQMRCVNGLGEEKLKGIADLITGFVAPPKKKKSKASGSNAKEASKRKKNSQFLLASWNIRNLSRNRSAEKLDKVLQIFQKFDLVAIQEVRDHQVLQVMQDKLGKTWDYAYSDFVGTSSHKERYAFFWRNDRVKKLSEPKLVNDVKNDWVREPFMGYFKAGEFDFVLATIHVVWGSSIGARREEIKKLDDVLHQILKRSGSEKDIILCGDFNMPPDDQKSWQVQGWQPLINPPEKTLVGDTSLYDNIWISTENTSKSEFSGNSGVICFDKDLYEDTQSGRRKAISEISDHRPIWGAFKSDVDDDSDVEIDFTDLKIHQ